MSYPSLLWTSEPRRYALEPDVFEDIKMLQFLNSEIIEAIRRPCCSEDIPLRQELFKELEKPELRGHFNLLERDMREIKRLDECLKGVRTDSEKHIVYLSLMRAVMKFYSDAAQTEGSCRLCSRFSGFFKAELEKTSYIKMRADIDEIYPLTERLGAVKFHIHNEALKLSPDASPTYLSRINECAANLGLSKPAENKIVQAQLSKNIIMTAAGLYSTEFKRFGEFYDSYKNYYLSDILSYSAELGFYTGMANVIGKIKEAGIPLIYPKVSDKKVIRAADAYDVTLLIKDSMKIIPNDIDFSKDEPFFYLTGANGGGKTTYLRAVGITVLMFLNGCPVACREAEIYPVEKVFTHFPRDERFENIGRFTDEENRVSRILENVDENSLVLLNETYSTTNEDTAVELTGALADKLYDSGAYGIYITHQHGISETKIPYLNVVVDRSDANRRTYKVEKRRSEHGSYAADILKKYALDKNSLTERFGGKR